MAILLALFAGLSNAVATILQRIGVEASPASSTSGLMASVLRRPIWFLGLLFMTMSFLLQAFALSFGALSVVQPVQVTEIVFLLAILGLWFRRPLGWMEWLGAVGTAVGLGIFLGVSAPTGGGLRPGITSWGMVLGAATGAIVISLCAASRGSRSWRAAWFGVAGGIAFAVTAAFLKVSSSYVRVAGISHLFVHWQPYCVAIAGLAGLLISQHALQAGPIAASQSALLIVNPVSSILMGVLLFGDRLQTTQGRLAVDVISLCVMFIGLFLLSHSPLIASPGAEEHLSGGRPKLDAAESGDAVAQPVTGT
jgi:drug/metabolite transporter (DMT)-like permease